MPYTRDEIISKAKQLESAGAPASDIEEFVSLASKEMAPETLAGKTFGLIRNFAPPIPTNLSEAKESAVGLAAPVISRPAQVFERGGQKVKAAAQDAVSRAVSSPFTASVVKSPEAVAAAGTLASSLVEAAPFTPSEFAASIGAETLPAPAGAIVPRAQRIKKSVADQFVGTSGAAIEKSIKTGIETAGQKLLRLTDLSGSRDDVFMQANRKIGSLEKSIQSKIETVANEETAAKYYTIARDKIASAFDNVVEDLKTSGFNNSEVKKIGKLKSDFIKAHEKSGTVEYWNKVKRSIYGDIGNKNYLKDQTSAKIDAQIEVARKIREEIEKAIPEIGPLNRLQGDYLDIRNSLAKTIAKGEKRIDFLSGEKEAAALSAARKISAFENIYKTRGLGLIPASIAGKEDLSK